jgi:hypothetical protein
MKKQPQGVKFPAITIATAKTIMLQEPTASKMSDATQNQQKKPGKVSIFNGKDFERTMALDEPGPPLNKPFLLRRSSNELIPLDKSSYRIGKEKSFVDYCICDNVAISRSHAKFISRNGEYFIVDTNSTNHVFVNGSRIPENTEIKMEHDDVVTLANEVFVFRFF